VVGMVGRLIKSNWKKKSFTDRYKKKHCEKFPQVESVVCHCEKRHTPGCGCLSVAFIEKAQNREWKNWSMKRLKSPKRGE
jgi:hypothetical protein